MNGDFIDSNVFVYLFDDVDTRKRDIAAEQVEAALMRDSAVISYQVAQETLNVLLYRLATPVTRPDARQFLDRVLKPLWRVMPSADLLQAGVDIQARYGYRFYDSLIIAAALEAGCMRLLSEDMQHGQRIEGLTIENPFR